MSEAVFLRQQLQFCRS